MHNRELDYNKPENFIQGIILVHPLEPNSILNCLFDTGKEYLAVYNPETENYDAALSSVNALVNDDTLLTNEAVIATHLAFEKFLYTNSFVDRPHIHWWWNGLFQANRGGDWEQSLIAYIEPLSQFKHVLSCAYYDTMTIGPHQLSRLSCIVLPMDYVPDLAKRLKSYEGKLIGYNPKKTTLRQAIHSIISKHYPEAFTLLNSNHQDINEVCFAQHDPSYNRLAGYFDELYITPPNQNSTLLIRSEKQILHPGYKQYAHGRYLGLHGGSPTDHESNPLIKILALVSRDPKKIADANIRAHFIGFSGDKKIDQLCIVKAYHIFKQLLPLGSHTGIHSYAYYLIKKAIIADFESIHYEKTKTTQLSIAERQEMLESHFNHLLQKIENLVLEINQDDLINYRVHLCEIYNRVVKPIELKQAGSTADTINLSSSPDSFWNRNKNNLMIAGAATLIGAGILAGIAYFSNEKNTP